MENWISIYSTDKAYLAEIAKEVLFENGIDAVVVNKKDSNYLFGLVEVHVKTENAMRGKHVLSKLENQD
jgi:hypothetical protein